MGTEYGPCALENSKKRSLIYIAKHLSGRVEEGFDEIGVRLSKYQ